MSPPVVIAVVSYNTRELLRRCLESLEADAKNERAEVWVVDNASDDGSAEMVAEDFGWVELVASDDNLGFGRAVNEVALRTSSPWIVAANSDIRVEPGAIDALVAAGESDPGAAVLAPRLIGEDGNTQHSVHSFPTVTLAAVVAFGLGERVPAFGERFLIEGHWDPSRPARVPWAHGAFLLCRRDVFEEVGGFDRDQWMYAEDLDLAWRVRQAGASVRYVPGARIAHVGAASTHAAFGDARSARFMRASFTWMLRRRGLIVTLSYAVISLAGAILRWLIFGFLSIFDPARFGARRDAARGWIGLHSIPLRGRKAIESLR